jgi:hypothetical protein
MDRCPRNERAQKQELVDDNLETPASRTDPSRVKRRSE